MTIPESNSPSPDRVMIHSDDELVEARRQVSELQEENQRLRRELARLRSLKQPQKADYASSRLRDALRE